MINYAEVTEGGRLAGGGPESSPSSQGAGTADQAISPGMVVLDVVTTLPACREEEGREEGGREDGGRIGPPSISTMT